MAETGQTLAERRAAVAAATAALRSLPRVLSLVSDEGLAGMAAELSELRALAGSAIVATLAEAEQRGVVAESPCASARGWIADAAWHSRREAGSIANAAAVLALPDLAPVSEALLSGDVDIPTAVAIAAEFSALASDLRADALPLVLDRFIEIGATHGPAGARQLTETLLARYGGEGTFEDHADRCRRHIHLSAARDSAAGLWDYRLTVDNEGHAVVEAVIGPLSAPKPNPNGGDSGSGDSDTGDRDTRSVGQRRGEALIAALRRSVSAAAHVPTSPKAILTVTVGVDELRRQIGAGVVAGTLAAGTTLPPDTLRKLACDAGVIPAVLGSDGVVLDHGREVRLFTPAQIRFLWQRDDGCSFDRCDAPATWCDAHHLVHWVDGGPTDANNGALLCGRHHTVVHRDRLAGRLVDGRVIWDLRPGSYRPPGAVGSPAACPRMDAPSGANSASGSGARRQRTAGSASGLNAAPPLGVGSLEGGGVGSAPGPAAARRAGVGAAPRPGTGPPLARNAPPGGDAAMRAAPSTAARQRPLRWRAGAGAGTGVPL